MPVAVVGDYEVSRKIGEGGYGRIFLGRRITSSPDAPEVVLKQVKLPAKKFEREMCLREVSIMKGVHHPCILECVESFIHRDSVYIVMPHCSGGDLASLLARQRKRGRRLPESIVVDWFAQIVLGVEFLHSHNTLHRDLKSQNVFLRRDHLPGVGAPGRSRVALGDFGVARELQLDKVAARTFIGTPIFMSPEMFRHAPYGHKADMWALGCILYEMMALAEPFRAKSMKGLARQVQHGTPARLPDQYGKHTRDVAYDLLRKNPDERPSARELIRDRPRLRDACASILRDAGAANGRERTSAAAASGQLGQLGRASAVNAFDAAQMAGRRRADMRLPAAATKDEHAARSERTAAKQARRCGVYAGDARDDEEDDGTDPAFAFARSPRVVGITAAAASRRAALVPLSAPIREEPEVENATGGGGGSGSRPTESPPPRGYTRASGGPRGRPGMKFYRARIATRGVSGAGSPSRRVRRGPRGAAPPPSSAAPRGWARRDRVMVPPHARHQPRLAADRWHAPSASRDTHLPKLPGRERAGGVPRGPRGGYWENERIAENARRRNDRVARLDAPRGGGFTRTTNVLNLALRRGFIPLRASMTRVDARATARGERARTGGGEASRGGRGASFSPRRARDGWGSRCVRRPSRRRVRRGRGWDGASRRRGGGGDGGERERRRLGRLASRGCDATARAVRSTRRGINRRPGINPRWTRTRRDSVGTRARGGVRGARGMRHHELQARFRAAPAVRRG